ncbi:hypothetical protein DPMN_193130 [Dreissena polymorpha]|uniref:Uncharacterized protein n=1 Tax=Dreissena polymorpha TaxID=45954 RepID=A0A9D3Y284_DREPO|nr:hypothetical protein DPMN_193130 [Dreissena polymorpha]
MCSHVSLVEAAALALTRLMPTDSPFHWKTMREMADSPQPLRELNCTFDTSLSGLD